MEAADRYWPTWGHRKVVIHDGRPIPPYAELARFVSREAVDGLAALTVARPDDTPSGDRAAAWALFDKLSACRIHYAFEPWLEIGTRTQQIRHPEWLLADRVGTCLDLAVTFASMCLATHVRPLLVVGERHALVAVVPGARRGELDLPGCVQVTPGVFEVEDEEALEAALGADLVPVECTDATHRVHESGARIAPAGFEQAVTDGIAAMRAGGAARGREPLRLVDVAWVHRSPADPYPPPRGWLDVRMFLPGGTGQEALFGGQRALFDRLRAERGIHVILAPSGQGKSTIARRLVAETPNGAAWFLAASEEPVLAGSLAAAELAQINRPAAGLSDADRADHTGAALRRLHEAKHPWVVAIDNADRAPDRMYRMLPRPQGEQLVVVTSTNEAWLRNQNVTCHRLDPLTDDEVAGELANPALVPLVRGRALLVDGFKRAAEVLDCRTADLAVDAPAEDSELAGPSALWSLLLEPLGAAAVGAARRAAFLPPDNIRLAVLPETESQALIGAGVLDYAEGDEFARMHRLIGAAIRDQLARDEGPEPRRAVVEQITRDEPTRRLLADFGDAGLLKDLLKQLLEREAGVTGADRGLGESFAAVGETLELRNQMADSATAYEHALRHLDEARDEDRPLIAASIHGIVRRTYRHADDEPTLREALEQQKRAHELMRAAGLGARAGKFLALRGNIEVKLSKFAGDDAAVAAALRAAVERLKEAHALRLEDPATPPEELARSEYNLAGPFIRLSQVERDAAKEHLKGAQEAYGAVLARRIEIYATDVHEHIAACIAGLGTVEYLRALLVAATPDERTALLRGSTTYALDSARQREALAGTGDDADVGKSYRLLAKIAMARHAGSLPRERAARQHSALTKEIDRELGWPGDLL